MAAYCGGTPTTMPMAVAKPATSNTKRNMRRKVLRRFWSVRSYMRTGAAPSISAPPQRIDARDLVGGPHKENDCAHQDQQHDRDLEVVGLAFLPPVP